MQFNTFTCKSIHRLGCIAKEVHSPKIKNRFRTPDLNLSHPALNPSKDSSWFDQFTPSFLTTELLLHLFVPLEMHSLRCQNLSKSSSPSKSMSSASSYRSLFFPNHQRGDCSILWLSTVMHLCLAYVILKLRDATDQVNLAKSKIIYNSQFGSEFCLYFFFWSSHNKVL